MTKAELADEVERLQKMLLDIYDTVDILHSALKAPGGIFPEPADD